MNVKTLRRFGAVVACLFLASAFLGCQPAPDGRGDRGMVGRTSRPIDCDPYFAEQVGREALEKIGYIPIMNLARQAGWITTKERKSLSSSARALLGQSGAAAARGFVDVFSKYAVAAGVTSQMDSPAPGPFDVVGIGIVVIGLIDAGLLAGAILDAVADTAPPAAGTTTSKPTATPVPTVTAPPVALSKPKPDLDKDEECYEKCKHLLPSPSGDLQASEYRKCYRECKGTL